MDTNLSMLKPILRWNRGKGRKIRTLGPPLFHESVRQRMAVAELNYQPKAKTRETIKYVE